jgi:hypothetical protein
VSRTTRPVTTIIETSSDHNSDRIEAKDTCGGARNQEKEYRNLAGLGLMFLAAGNLCLGIVVGIRYRVMILLPLAGLVIIEVLLLELPGGTWISALWRSVILMTSLEAGYLVGAALRAFFPATALLRIGSDQTDQPGRNLPLH